MALKLPTETSLDSDLNALFDQLPEEFKISAGQAALATGLKMVLEHRSKQIQEDMLNITETDPSILTGHYVMLRLQNLLLHDMRNFLEYAGQYYINQTGQAEGQ